MIITMITMVTAMVITTVSITMIITMNTMVTTMVITTAIIMMTAQPYDAFLMHAVQTKSTAGVAFQP